MNQPNNLSLEQQLKLTITQRKVDRLSLKQSKQYLFLTLEYMLIKDNMIKFLIRNKKF
uniref:phycobilisome degradation protein n=1 Tax=Rhodochorton tenue TaxID=173034 RepID=UPI002A80296C|nr:phycobilisome degradation protein [Rhodochorton tenue]WOK79545.1 phycobilisome degradation protein [Rhodochorton tenue]